MADSDATPAPGLGRAAGAGEAETTPEGGSRRRAPFARSIYGDIVQFIDFILVTAAAPAAAYVYHAFVIAADVDLQRYLAAGILGATGATAILRRDGFYEFDQILSPALGVRAVVSRWALVVLGLIAFAFSFKISESFSRFWLFAWFATCAVALVTTRFVAGAVLRRAVKEDGAFARRIAIVGSNDAAQKFAELARASEQAVSIVGVFESDLAGASARKAAVVDGDLAALARAARAGAIDDIVIAEPDASAERMDALVQRLSVLPVSIAICPTAYWLNHTGGELARIGGAPVLNLYRRPLEGWGGLLKSLEDMALGGALFVLALPLMAAIAAAIKLQDGGPVLFAQKRHGFNHSVFRIYKFRTMTVAEDGDRIVQAHPGDPRITPIGRFLRRYSLDELPQLINVLKGEMSLVGPRPHALAHNHAYAQIIENYSGRHKVKPGITGWAQVNGCRGETSENELMEARVRYDLAYIDNWSLWFDLKILSLTVFAVLFPKNAH
ncbi:undecaprenyl-phosphate glucose phosphotransferase [Amphiplicatus metriothermophilus]|uniref:Putative colanic acid biosysnthesis UDP-glucose lipid carrier transferase n=1 Tax=Amphiplicatus metriothermophilus TaxID=1519374 RepID=A0A239PJ65_9PROT|nr:undecaprenyl-phosphate glucose phosphotransferase [Amphiplicatus metriothermophilus]MBB5517858.1 putative colanic acid biosynthesis UDP-glucose lipid carrier transferase [Amphiplicatus metriothermophilus]SNT67808.1 putative colanic acid biosysnthesis UDP-glucose lipid carrier transferase [Amphiplicatus metriothermophilus]